MDATALNVTLENGLYATTIEQAQVAQYIVVYVYLSVASLSRLLIFTPCPISSLVGGNNEWESEHACNQDVEVWAVRVLEDHLPTESNQSEAKQDDRLKR
jgi:hypothetical protein